MFGVNMSTLCRDAADTLWHNGIKFVITFCRHVLNMISVEFGENWTDGLGGV